MATITDLASASSVSAGDNLVINQSGTDRKVTADKFAVRSLSNTLTGENNFTGGIILDDTAYQRASGTTLFGPIGGAPGQIATFRTNANVLLVLVFGTDGSQSFVDLVLAFRFWGAIAIGSRVAGTPANRTYAAGAGGDLTLAMSSGSYNVRIHILSNLYTS